MHPLLEKLFGFDSTKTTVKTEILAGITIFLTMSYILAVNPKMFAVLEQMPSGAVFTATALAAIVGTLVMSLVAKMPFGLAPGLGLNAFFVYTVCLGMNCSWQFALTAVFIEGLIFILLTVTSIREAIVDAIPHTMKTAISAGIGLFIAFIGLQNAGIIVNNESTLVAIGDLTNKNTLLAIIGLIITSWLVVKNIKGGMLLGILITSAIGIPLGITHWDGIVSTPQSISDIAFKFEWDKIFTVDMVVVVLTFLFIDMFGAMGTFVGVCLKAGMVGPDGKIARIKQAFLADAIATTAGACMGVSATTTYVESAAGVAQGGRTGLVSFVIAVCFAISLFFSPLFLAIPSAATAPILIIVGLFMMSSVKEIPFEDYAESIPAFIAMIMMPLTYSIAEGVLLGMISYVVINFLCGNYKRLTPSMYIIAILFILKYVFIK
ncbi:MAG: NCS2 family permease [Bacteroidales bacterium]|nr:NCS2 family permease [Bacteroidales bacterium]